jgi:hypothetical protein
MPKLTLSHLRKHHLCRENISSEMMMLPTRRILMISGATTLKNLKPKDKRRNTKKN